MQRSLPILLLCIDICPLVEEKGCHLLLILLSR
jgi:hypothetical protein